jgi:poly(hydroxyalkanoate) depolymerase family esterase
MNLPRSAVLMTASLAACAAAPGPGSTPVPAREDTFEWHTWAGEAGTRRYKLFVPASADPARPAPLVVMLHGCTQDPDDFARGTRFNEAAREHGIIVAWPEQTNAHQVQKCWTWYDSAHQGRDAGEPGIIAGIVREVMASHRVDPARVYVAGISAGAAMAVNTAAAYPELFAAVAAHSGVPYRAAGSVPDALAVMKQGAPSPDALTSALREAMGERRMIPLILVHGLADAVLNPRNTEQLAEQWLALGGMAERLTESRDGGGYAARRTTVGDDLELWMVEGLGHAWSGGSPEGTYTDPRGPNATREILRFFLAHPRR